MIYILEETMLSFKFSEILIQRLNELHTEFAGIYATLSHYPEKLKAELHQYAKISMIGSSTRIENAVLTDAEILWIDTILTKTGNKNTFPSKKLMIEDKLHKDKERSIEEVAGCRAMLELIYNQGNLFKPLTESIVRGLHSELLQYYHRAGPYVGCYKKQPNFVVETDHKNKKQRIVFKTAEAGPITEAAMRDLIVWYNETQIQESRSIAVACEFVYRFLAIHPFQDGNGRLGRGLFLLALLQSNDIVIADVIAYIAIDRHIERYKSEYYYVLHRCSNGKYQQNPTKYHIDYFLEFMIKILKGALADVGLYKKRFDAYLLLSESAKTVLTCFKGYPEVRLTKRAITEMTDLAPRTVTYSLTTLVKNKFIQKQGQGAGVRYQLIF